MIRAWMSIVKKENIGYFDNRFDYELFCANKNSGFVEGLNHRIRVLFGRCHGMLNKTHIFKRVNLDLSGYDLSRYDLSGYS
ncbi:hypothetical protein CCP3SC15_1770005 [Gammaproteobacteria bacterium]